MTLAEKVSQTRYDAPAIPRLGIPAYVWWSEALDRAALQVVDPKGRADLAPGPVVISVGGEQPGFTGRLAAGTAGVLTGTVQLEK